MDESGLLLHWLYLLKIITVAAFSPNAKWSRFEIRESNRVSFPCCPTRNRNVGNQEELRVSPTRLYSSHLQNDPESGASNLHLVFPGGGIFFYWQAGAVTYLLDKGYLDSSKTTFTVCGASAGALVATLLSLSVDFRQATRLALQLAEDANVWKRPQGLQGVWGSLIEQWLDELLPNDIRNSLLYINDDGTLHSRLSILVTPVISLEALTSGWSVKQSLHQFTDKEDLIRANMASIHLPWFLDGKATAMYSGSRYIDGSFRAKDSDYFPSTGRYSIETTKDPNKCSSKLLVLDFQNDIRYNNRSTKDMLDFVSAVSPSRIWEIFGEGNDYMAQLDAVGRLEFLKSR
jgi:hypothetical protein